jgi:hypothetical protein
MECKNYLGYKVYENGNVENKKGVILKPQIKGGYSFYKINGKKISSGQIVLFAFSIYPKYSSQKAKRKDKDISNNSLENLEWKI